MRNPRTDELRRNCITVIACVPKLFLPSLPPSAAARGLHPEIHARTRSIRVNPLRARLIRRRIRGKHLFQDGIPFSPEARQFQITLRALDNPPAAKSGKLNRPSLPPRLARIARAETRIYDIAARRSLIGEHPAREFSRMRQKREREREANAFPGGIARGFRRSFRRKAG